MRARGRPANRGRAQRRRLRGDDGAALVEAALVTPLFFLVVFGLFEFSGMMSSYSGASHTSRAGARVESAAANDPMADQQAFARMAVEAAGMGHDEIDVIVVWHASSTSEAVPSSCLPASTTAPNTSSVGVSDGGVDSVGACNVYIRPGAPGGAFQMARGELAHPPSYYFGCTGAADPDAAHKVDCKWPAMNRKAVTTPRSVSPPQTPDLLGVYVKATHENVTGFFGRSITVTDRTITQLEPQGYKLS